MNQRPEQTFFEDASIDRAMGLIMTLAAELYVARDQVRVLETLLVNRGVLNEGELHNFVPTPEQKARWDTDRDAYVAALMQNVKGLQASKGVG